MKPEMINQVYITAYIEIYLYTCIEEKTKNV